MSSHKVPNYIYTLANLMRYMRNNMHHYTWMQYPTMRHVFNISITHEDAAKVLFTMYTDHLHTIKNSQHAIMFVNAGTVADTCELLNEVGFPSQHIQAVREAAWAAQSRPVINLR